MAINPAGVYHDANNTAPSPEAAAITVSDATVFTKVTRGLFVGGAGAVSVVMANGDTVTFTGVVAGSILPIRVKQVLSTGTTATNMVGLW